MIFLALRIIKGNFGALCNFALFILYFYRALKNFLHMNIRLNPKEITDAYSTPIVQQTSFWSKVKEQVR